MHSRERTQSELDSPAPNMVDTVIRTRSLGVGAEGVPDQYSDGKAARVWEFYIGSRTSRTRTYKDWFARTLKSHGCKTVLDVACGTGVDSMMLMEEGFRVISSDASDKMLKYALKERWDRRKEKVFDEWVIEEANWLTLVEDLETVSEKPQGGFDAVICVGNSFAHLPDFSGELTNQRIALENFKANVKPGGIMVIDHRNYDAILDSGSASTHNVYYNSQCITDIQVSSLAVNGRPTMITLDYMMDMSRINMTKEEMRSKKMKADDLTGVHKFRLSYYPHRLAEFTKLLKSVFGEDCKHKVYADFKELDEEPNPAYYIHVIQTPAK